MSKVIYKVKCPHCKNEFPLVVEVEEGSSETISNADVYCPHCNKVVKVKVEGKLVKDAEVFKRFGFDE
jgi:phage terminase large subunit GpA-like protein